MKKVICIGGTSRSGSTLLDNILANDPRAMSLGEIVALFHPTRKHHFEELDNLKKQAIWSNIINSGKRNLYPNLFKFFPEKDIFIDSSKDPFWFRYHEKVKKENYLIEHVLIYKKPIELAQSFRKRGKKDHWIRTYISYHKKYFSLIDRFRTVSYKDLVTNELALQRLCEYLKIEYFDSKKNYWERPQETFFGSNSVRAHSSIHAKKQLSHQERKDIIYDVPNDLNLENIVKKIVSKNPIIREIEYHNKCLNILSDEVPTSTHIPHYNIVYLSILQIKKFLLQTYRYYYPAEIFSKK